MTSAKMNAMLVELRTRAESGRPDLVSPVSADELARALHELDVYQAELEIQNQDLLATQRALASARDKYHLLFDAALTPMFSVSAQGVVVDANRAMTMLVDRARERFVGRPFVVCLDAGEPTRYFEHLKATRETSRAQQVELSMRTSGGRLRQIVVKSCPLGSEGSFLCHATDVTEERAAQRERSALEARLREAEKVEAIGRVAANIAHDVNNVLMAIVSIAEFVQGELPPESHAAKETAALIEAAWRGGRLMRGLLGLSRPSTRVRHSVNLGALVEQVVRMCRHTKPGVDVMGESPSEPLLVDADEDELLQAVLNLAKNGLEATSHGAVTIKCGAILEHDSLQAELRVTDTGTGMDAETLERATEPLFTTKAQVGGSGLGLTMVHRAVTSLGGFLELESEPGRGTTVTLRLPLSPGGVGQSKPAPEPPPRASELRVLLVDDDPGTRVAVKRQLTHGGVAVHDFAEGPSALAAVEAGLVVDAAVVDVNMPIWSGPELVERLLAIDPELPVLFITGASGNLIPDWMLARRQALLLQKPWPRDTLLSSLASIVGPPAGEARGASR